MQVLKAATSVSLSLAASLLATSLAYPADTAASRLKVGVVQMAVAQSVEANRDRIVSGIAQAVARGVRVAVFPEGVLRGQGGDDRTFVSEGVEAIRRAAREASVYVVFGGYTLLPHLRKAANWMLVVGPDGRDVFRYEKLYDSHRSAMPGVFSDRRHPLQRDDLRRPLAARCRRDSKPVRSPNQFRVVLQLCRRMGRAFPVVLVRAEEPTEHRLGRLGQYRQ